MKFDSNDQEIKFAFGDMSQSEEQVFLSQLKGDDLARVQSLRLTISEIGTLQDDIPPMQLSAERLKVAIDQASPKSLGGSSWFNVKKMWMPVAASLVLAGFFFVNRSQSPSVDTGTNIVATNDDVQVNVSPSQDSNFALNIPEASTPVVPKASDNTIAKANNSDTNIVSPNASSVASVETSQKASGRRTVRNIFRKPIRNSAGSMSVASLNIRKDVRTKSSTNSDKGGQVSPQSLIESEVPNAFGATDGGSAAFAGTRGAALTPSATSPNESVLIGGGAFDSAKIGVSLKPEIVIIINSPKGSDSNEAVEVNHRVNIVIGS